MGRPVAVTPEIASVIVACDTHGLTVSALLRRVQAQGVDISRKALETWLRAVNSGAEPLPAPAKLGPPQKPTQLGDTRPPKESPRSVPATPAPGAAVAPLEQQAAAAIADDNLGELIRARRVIGEALRWWDEQIKVNPQAVSAYDRLLKLLATVTRSIAELTPAPEIDRYKPIAGAALDALLARAEAAAAAQVDARARLGAYEKLLAEGKLVAADG